MIDREIIEAIKEKDTSALEFAIEQYSGYVMAVVQHTLGRSASGQDKEELVADVFAILWEKAWTLNCSSTLKPWLAVVARNASINKLRTIQHFEELQDDFLISDDSIVTSHLETEERATLVREAIDSLSCEDRNLFIRYYFWHQSISIIAEETGMTPSTIKSRLFRGRKVLKAILSQKGRILIKEA